MSGNGDGLHYEDTSEGRALPIEYVFHTTVMTGPVTDGAILYWKGVKRSWRRRLIRVGTALDDAVAEMVVCGWNRSVQQWTS